MSGTGLRFVLHKHTVEILPKQVGDQKPPAQAAERIKSQNYHLGSNSRPTEPGDPPPSSPRSGRPASTGTALHEVVVTAQLYRQPAFDVPFSLNVLTATALTNLRVFDLNALQYQVPGVYIQTGAGVNRITIDGVGNGIGSGALVGEYIDEADVTGEGNTGSAGTGTGDLGLYDVSRVEVLHGPQGTLYGDGSMGGVIRVVTNKPDLYQTQFSSDVAALFTQYGAPSQHIQTMLNIPLVAGALGLRFAGSFEHDGGWVDEPEADAKNVNNGNLTDMRFEALWRPSAGLNINATQIIRRDAYGVDYSEDAQGNIAAPLPFGLTTTPQGAQAFNLSNLTVSYSLDSVRLLSSSTYFTHTFDFRNAFWSPETGASVSQYFLYHNEGYKDTDFSQELRLSNATDGPWQWMLGGFYKHYIDTEAQNASLTYSTPAPPVINFTFSGYDTGSNSDAAFANSSYTVDERLEIGGGLRYYSANDTYNAPTFNYHGYAGLGIVPGKFDRGSFSATDPRLYVRYGLTSRVNIYGTASKGFREGGFNGPGLPNYQPESLWRYDLGLKSRFLNNELQSDLDLFYSDYSKYVVEGYFPAVNNYYLANAGTAHIKGVNADIKWRESKNWLFGVNGEYVDAKFVSITAADTGYNVGNGVPLVTKYSFSASIERYFQLQGKAGDAVVSYSEISGVQLNVVGYIYPVAQSDVMRFLNFNSSIELNSNLSVGLFVRNLLNDRGYLDPFWIYGYGSRPQPRTLGVDFRANL